MGIPDGSFSHYLHAVEGGLSGVHQGVDSGHYGVSHNLCECGEFDDSGEFADLYESVGSGDLGESGDSGGSGDFS